MKAELFHKYVEQFITNMKIFKTISFLFLMLSTVFSYAGILDQDINKLDENGKRTGYWIITGSMSKEKGYKPDAKVEEGEYVRSRKTGLWKKYWPNGKLKSEITYVRGRPNGDYVTYFENGNIQEKSSWGGNKQTGTYEMYYENGQLMKKKEFSDNGKSTGKVVYYYENGQKELEFSTVDGVEEGEAVWYYANGDVKAKKDFTGGTVTKEETFERVNPEYVDKTPKKVIKGPKASGAENEAQGGKEGSAIVDGHHITYDKDKNILMEGEFKDGRLYNGKHYLYDEFGLLDHIDIYKDGVFVGNGVIGDNF